MALRMHPVGSSLEEICRTGGRSRARGPGEEEPGAGTVHQIRSQGDGPPEWCGLQGVFAQCFQEVLVDEVIALEGITVGAALAEIRVLKGATGPDLECAEAEGRAVLVIEAVYEQGLEGCAALVTVADGALGGPGDPEGDVRVAGMLEMDLADQGDRAVTAPAGHGERREAQSRWPGLSGPIQELAAEGALDEGGEGRLHGLHQEVWPRAIQEEEGQLGVGGQVIGVGRQAPHEPEGMDATSCVAFLTVLCLLQRLWGPLDLNGDALSAGGRLAFCVDVGHPGFSGRGVSGVLRGDGPAGVVCGQGDLGFEEEMLLGFWGGGAGAAAGMGEEGGAQRAGLGNGRLVAAAGA